jgi:antitoxin Phd
MQFDTNEIITVTEANQNFSRATKIADREGRAVIFKNNRPQYLLVSLQSAPLLDLTDEEKIAILAQRVLSRFRPAFEELAK